MPAAPYFYSRASREARPACVFDFSLAYLLFLLTRLSRGATASCNVAFPASMISTHAPLARRDNCSHFNKPKKHNFYSRASREARLAGRCPRIYIQRFLLTRLSRGATITNIIIPMITKFLLTRLSRGATKLEIEINKNASISTHAPLARRDFPFSQKTLRVGNFYSRASREARQQLRLQGHLSILHFYSRASREARRRTI